MRATANRRSAVPARASPQREPAGRQTEKKRELRLIIETGYDARRLPIVAIAAAPR
jgi:hypothetical protein